MCLRHCASSGPSNFNCSCGWRDRFSVGTTQRDSINSRQATTNNAKIGTQCPGNTRAMRPTPNSPSRVTTLFKANCPHLSSGRTPTEPSILPLTRSGAGGRCEVATIVWPGLPWLWFAFENACFGGDDDDGHHLGCARHSADQCHTISGRIGMTDRWQSPSRASGQTNKSTRTEFGHHIPTCHQSYCARAHGFRQRLDYIYDCAGRYWAGGGSIVWRWSVSATSENGDPLTDDTSGLSGVTGNNRDRSANWRFTQNPHGRTTASELLCMPNQWLPRALNRLNFNELLKVLVTFCSRPEYHKGSL